MLHTLIQTQPRRGPTKLSSIPHTLHRTLPLIHNLRIACKTIPAVALPSILRAEVMPPLARARTALHRHPITRSDRGGENAGVRAIRVAPLVPIPCDSRVAGDRDVGVILEHGDAVCSATGLGDRACAGHLALCVGPGLVGGGEDPRAVAFGGVLDAEVGVTAAEGGAGGPGVVWGGGHACAEGPRVERVGEAARVGVAGEGGFAGWGWRGGGGR